MHWNREIVKYEYGCLACSSVSDFYSKSVYPSSRLCWVLISVRTPPTLTFITLFLRRSGQTPEQHLVVGLSFQTLLHPLFTSRLSIRQSNSPRQSDQ